MNSKKKANYMVTNYTMTKGFSILCKALIIYILFYFIIGAVLISVVPDDLSVYLRLTVTCIFFKYVLFKNTDCLKKHWIIKTLIIGLLFASLHCASEVIKLDITAFICMFNYFIFYVATNIIYHKKENLMMVVIIHMHLCFKKAQFFFKKVNIF